MSVPFMDTSADLLFPPAISQTELHTRAPSVSPLNPSSDFFVRSLGDCKFDSPLLNVGGCVQFISDRDHVLLETDIELEAGSVEFHLMEKVQKAGPRKKLFFNPLKTSAGVVTCGGICPGLNNVIRSMVHVLWYRYGVKRILGFKYGYEGIVAGNTEPIELNPNIVRDIHQFGGTVLASSRGPQDPAKMVDFLVEKNIDILFCIGGDGTQKGARQIFREIEKRNLAISIVGIGKTIDNDLLFVDRSFGFETAVALSQQALISAHEEARSCKNGIGIVKLMGRESGSIALHASLANGDVNMLLVPELKFTTESIVNYLVERFKTRDHCLIVCAEGACQDLLPPSTNVDKSGNKIFQDVGLWLKGEIAKQLKEKKVEHSIKYIDPSYQIRAGIATSGDAILCTIFAQQAVHAAMAGKTDILIGLVHGDFVHLPLSKVTQGRKNVDIKGLEFQALLDATGSPFWE